jgi:crotonobetainyl-CoA:carnitine CoA-transferase CaiB-like acyl-CoA transferase
VLADLGADVIKLEPPGGAAARRLPPFEKGLANDPDGSLYWAAVGLGKRSAALDVFSASGADALRALLREADVFVESFEPGALDAVGLGVDVLRELNPRLVHGTVTPFGSDGPLAHAPATDLTLEAAGGLLGLQGDGDRPPLPVGFPQASFHAGVQLAADIVVALNERERSGLGQHLDCSMQAAIVWTLMNATGYPAVEGRNPPNTSEYRRDPPAEILPGLALPYLCECADGYAIVGLGLPGLGERTMEALVGWMQEAGALSPELHDVAWGSCIRDAAVGALEIGTIQQAAEELRSFVRGRTKRELQDFGAKSRILVAAIYDMGEVCQDPQLAARRYWQDVDGRQHPGAFATLSQTPVRLGGRAPVLPAPEAAIPGWLPRAGSAAVVRDVVAPSRGAFEGLKVADFAWVAVGPQMTKVLADHGATVVRVESETRLDITRQLPPFKDGEPGINRAQFMANFNTSKRGIALNLATPEGVELARRLVDWADVVAESFTPGTMDRFGLGYAALSAKRPDLVMLSTSMRGDSGPERDYTGFGTQGAALAGLNSITSWPERAPVGPWGAYTDFIAPRYGLAALAAALYHRSRTGVGQHIELPQVEAALHFVEPLLLDYQVNGRVAPAAGQASPYACPHGAYRTAGDERFLAIAVETAEQWHALVGLARLDAFAGRELGELEERIALRDEIEAALREWCRDYDAFELAFELRAAGVPAYAVQRPSDLHADPQLVHRGFFVTLDHAVMGPVPNDGPITHFSRTPAVLRHAAPTLGEHTHEVLTGLLGLSDDEITHYALAGALG